MSLYAVNKWTMRPSTSSLGVKPMVHWSMAGSLAKKNSGKFPMDIVNFILAVENIFQKRRLSRVQMLSYFRQELSGLSLRVWRHPLPSENHSTPFNSSQASSRAEICPLDVWVSRPLILWLHSSSETSRVLQLEYELQAGLKLSQTLRDV